MRSLTWRDSACEESQEILNKIGKRTFLYERLQHEVLWMPLRAW